VSVSHTTRAARPGEVHGKNYFFVSNCWIVLPSIG
jgi:guanylate kinase